MACGPNKFDLPLLTSRGEPRGRLVFTVHMIQQCRLTVHLPKVVCAMRALAHHTSRASQEATHREMSYSLSATLTGEAEEEAPPARAEFDASSLTIKDKAQVITT